MLVASNTAEHGVTGIDWKHYKHPLPEHVYDVYMQHWGSVIFPAFHISPTCKSRKISSN
jgi:hypothetical protein